MFFHVQRLMGQSEAGRIFQGLSPSGDGTNLQAREQAPGGFPSTIAAERYEEFSPGLDPELLKLVQATAEMELADVEALFGPIRANAAPSSKAGAEPADAAAAAKG